MSLAVDGMIVAFGTLAFPLTFCFFAYGEGFSKGEARLPPSREIGAISIKVVVNCLFALNGQRREGFFVGKTMSRQDTHNSLCRRHFSDQPVVER